MSMVASSPLERCFADVGGKVQHGAPELNAFIAAELKAESHHGGGEDRILTHRLAISATARRLESDLIASLHHQPARFAHRLARDEEFSSRARRAAAQAFRRQA